MPGVRARDEVAVSVLPGVRNRVEESMPGVRRAHGVELEILPALRSQNGAIRIERRNSLDECQDIHGRYPSP